MLCSHCPGLSDPQNSLEKRVSAFRAKTVFQQEWWLKAGVLGWALAIRLQFGSATSILCDPKQWQQIPQCPSDRDTAMLGTGCTHGLSVLLSQRGGFWKDVLELKPVQWRAVMASEQTESCWGSWTTWAIGESHSNSLFVQLQLRKGGGALTWPVAQPVWACTTLAYWRSSWQNKGSDNLSSVSFCSTRRSWLAQAQSKTSSLWFWSKHKQGKMLPVGLHFGEAHRDVCRMWITSPSPEHSALGARPGSQGSGCHGNTWDPKPVCCTAPQVELPLHVHSSLPIFHCILEENFFFYCPWMLECVGRAVHVNGWALWGASVLGWWHSGHCSGWTGTQALGCWILSLSLLKWCVGSLFWSFLFSWCGRLSRGFTNPFGKAKLIFLYEQIRTVCWTLGVKWIWKEVVQKSLEESLYSWSTISQHWLCFNYFRIFI